MTKPWWIVSQIGAREHYAVPRALAHRKRLKALYTDLWSGPLHRLNTLPSSAVRSFANRYHADLRTENVYTFPVSTVLLPPLMKRIRNWHNIQESYMWIGRQFAESVARSVSGAHLDAGPHAFVGYNTGCLETLPVLRDAGVTTVVAQIDPGRREQELVIEEAKRWPGWSNDVPELYEPYHTRIEKEWEAADHVLVNSEWSRRLVMETGLSSDKIHVVPLAYDAPAPPDIKTVPKAGPLRVLWLGQVILRKGIQYLIEAARNLSADEFEFVIAGPIGITRQAMAAAPSNMHFVGRLTREQTAAAYRNADVFVLPTLSDGFAITQLEAMAQGLPVVASRNCAEVVTDGVDGWLTQAGDAVDLARKLEWCAQNRDELVAMSGRTRQKLRRYTLDAYADALDEIYSLAAMPV